MTKMILLRPTQFGEAVVWNELPDTAMRNRTMSQMLALIVSKETAELLELREGDAIGFVIQEEDLVDVNDR